MSLENPARIHQSEGWKRGDGNTVRRAQELPVVVVVGVGFPPAVPICGKKENFFYQNLPQKGSRSRVGKCVNVKSSWQKVCVSCVGKVCYKGKKEF